VEERTSGRAWRALLMSAGRAYGRAHDDPDCLERCRIYANRVQFSKEYLVVYALMIAVNLGLLVWVIIEADYPLMHPARWAFLVADLFVTSFVVLEVTLNMCAVGWRRFWQLKSNWFDFSVMLLCVVVIAMHALGPLAELEAEEEVETAILICRYTAQIARLGVMAKNMRRQAQHQDLRITLDDDRGCLVKGQPQSPRQDHGEYAGSGAGEGCATSAPVGSSLGSSHDVLSCRAVRLMLRDESFVPSLAHGPLDASMLASRLDLARATPAPHCSSMLDICDHVRPQSPTCSAFSGVLTDPKEIPCARTSNSV